jgi:hypothetical protein
MNVHEPDIQETVPIAIRRFVCPSEPASELLYNDVPASEN